MKLEKIIENVVNHKYYRRGRDFSKYLVIGVIWTFLNIFLMWLLIDYWRFPTIYSTVGASVLLFFSKFYAYILVGLIENKFLRYTSTVIGFYIANVFLMWLFVDVIGLKAVISSTIIVVGSFVLRFVFFHKIGLIKNE